MRGPRRHPPAASAFHGAALVAGLASPLQNSPGMNPRHHRTRRKRSRTIVTTIGELIAAAYCAAYGEGREREERAAALLTARVLKRGLSRRLVFT